MIFDLVVQHSSYATAVAVIGAFVFALMRVLKLTRLIAGVVPIIALAVAEALLVLDAVLGGKTFWAALAPSWAALVAAMGAAWTNDTLKSLLRLLGVPEAIVDKVLGRRLTAVVETTGRPPGPAAAEQTPPPAPPAEPPGTPPSPAPPA